MLAKAHGGELLVRLEKKQGGTGHHNPPASVAAGSEYQQALDESNLYERTARRWQQIH